MIKHESSLSLSRQCSLSMQLLKAVRVEKSRIVSPVAVLPGTVFDHLAGEDIRFRDRLISSAVFSDSFLKHVHVDEGA